MLTIFLRCLRQKFDPETFYTYLNIKKKKKKKKIKCTYAKQIENKIPFLDILIIVTKTYRPQFFVRKRTQEYHLITLVLVQILINMG